MKNIGNKFILWVALLASVSLARSITRKLHPDVGKSIKDLVPKYGYPFESHTVTTEDGYILELHRIPHGKTQAKRGIKPVVLLQHGMLCSSDSWINMGPESGLGYLLADRGYDVWLGNHRGTTWSRKHQTLDPDVDRWEFWNFSFHEMGVYDNRAFIDYILDVTEQEQLIFVGHSQGTTSFFALTSVYPEYNSKIRLMVAFGPVTYTENLKSPLIHMLLPFKDAVWGFLQEHEIYGVMKHSKLITIAAQVFCNDDAPTQFLCVTLFSLIGGYNKPQSNKGMIPVIGSSSPSGASWKQFSHYLQGFKGGFSYYDYGEAGNLEHYGQAEPPTYNLDLITSPIALYYGNNDYLATEEDAIRTAAALPNVIISQRVQDFNHLDFQWAKDVTVLLYNDVLQLIENY